MKYTVEEYLAQDYFGPEDGVGPILSRRIVTTRKKHVCVPPTRDKVHNFRAGRVALREVAIVDGTVATCYICDRHMDEFIQEYTRSAPNGGGKEKS